MSDLDKINELKNLGIEYSKTQSRRSIDYLKQALKEYRSYSFKLPEITKKEKNLKAEILYYIGLNNLNMYKRKRALIHFEKAALYRDKIKELEKLVENR